MGKHLPLILLTLVIFTGAGVFGQETNKSVDTATSRLDKLRAEGNDAMYNLDYDTARRRFEEMARLFPDHPAGAQSYAASLWLQHLNQSWRLKASLYNSDSYTSNKDKADPKVVAEFRQWARRAKTLSEARLRLNSADIEALYFLGATEGLESAFAAAVESRYLAALRNGSRAVDRHRSVLKIAPDYRDAELTIGLYNYIVGSLPLSLKIMAGTIGYRGSKKRGLETLERVANEGRWARDLARVLLMDLYKREKRWKEAAALATDLSARYPKNYIFKLQIADALSTDLASQRQKNSVRPGPAEYNRVFDIFENLLRDQTLIEVGGSTSAIIHFRYGEALLLAGHNERAAREFLIAAKRSPEAGLVTLARLRAAQSLDLLGKRPEALVEYRAVLTGPDIYNLHQEARRGLREPYKSTVK
jgi:tetratricopeptide (TPR) repeat protein